MSIRGTPEKCPKPCPSVSFDLKPIEITNVSQFGENETITYTDRMQPVEIENFPKVESIDSESDIDPFTTMYGDMDEDSFHRMMEGNDWTYSPLFSDKEFLNEDWHKYTCTEACAAIGNVRHGCKCLGTDIQSIREIDDSGCTMLSEIGNMVTNMTGSSILKSTGHTGQVKPVNLSVRFILGDRDLHSDEISESESEGSLDSDDDWQSCVSSAEKTTVHLSNHSNESGKIFEGEMIGCLDMRSSGYFHVSKETLQQILQTSFKDNCSFLSERETEEYFNLYHKDHKEVINYMSTQVNQRLKQQQGNTELVDRNEPDEDTQELLKGKGKDPYPWLDAKDPRKKMTDQEILEKYIDLSDSDLDPAEKRSLYKVLLKYKDAFSLRDEIGLCPNMEIELEINDETPFFIRPFPIKETEKDVVDKEKKKGCMLGILKKGMSSYSSPIMLIPRKLTGIPRIVTDFRHFNSRLVTLQPSIPLVRDAIQILGSSGSEVLSLADLRDAYHTLRLSKRSQKFCGITPYYGSDSYLYQRLGMGLSVSPAIWQNFIQRILQEIPDYRKNHLAIMDDILTHSKRVDHIGHLIDLFKAIMRNGLKISPRKCMLFKKELVFMGITILAEEGMPKMRPLKSRIDAIQKVNPPKTIKECRSFCGMVNYMSMFLPSLQEKLIPIYFITRKGIPFYWGEEQQKAFEDIKRDVTNAPVLLMPNSTGHFVLVSDTSKIGYGAALYQKQRGKYHLIAYYSKRLPEAVTNYRISELELTGVMANLLRNANFHVYCTKKIKI